jgi:hypothetical protein
MSPPDAANSGRRGRMRQRRRAMFQRVSLSRIFVAFARYVGVALGLHGAGIVPAPAQSVDYRSSQSAPASWRDYAMLTQAQLRDRLAADDDRAQDFRKRLQQAGSSSTPAAIVARLWIAPDGRIDRVEADGIDADTARMLGIILSREKLKAKPPADMLQPLHLKLSLAADANAPGQPQ